MHNERLKPCYAKIDRAIDQLEEFARQVDPGGSEGRYGTETVIDLEANEIIIRTLDSERFFVDLAILAGEIIHHSRSALEHAVWILSKAPEEYVTGFPVATPDAKFGDRASLLTNKGFLNKIASVSDLVRTMIVEFQPMFPAFQSNELYILNELWKQEKHRLLNMVGVTEEVFQIYLFLPDGKRASIAVGFSETLEANVLPSNTELGRFTIPDGFASPDMKAVVVMVSAIKFSDAGPATGRLAEQMLRELVSFASFILFRLDEASAGVPYEQMPHPWFAPRAPGAPVALKRSDWGISHGAPPPA